MSAWSHQEVVVHDLMSSWRSVTSGVLQGLVPLNVLICDTDSGVKCTFIKLAGDIKLSCGVDIPEGEDAFQKGQDKLKK